MSIEEDNYRRLKDYALSLGFSLFGVADVRDLAGTYCGIDPGTGEKLNQGVSLALRLSDAVLEAIGGHPTRLYLHHYRQANYFLDRGAFELSRFIQDRGAQALPIAASQTLDWGEQRGHLSHKEVARRAGLGWLGRNNLLVTQKFGSRVRLVTVLTDLPLKLDVSLSLGCGDCRRPGATL